MENFETMPTPPTPSEQKKTAGKTVKRVLLGVLATVLALVILVVSVFLFIFYSPWTHTLRDQYILMTYNTSNPWLCTLFFSEEMIEQVHRDNGSIQPEGEVNTDLIRPNPGTTQPTMPSNPGDPSNPTTPTQPTPPTTTPPLPEPTFKTSDKYGGEVIYDDGQVQVLKFNGTTPKGKFVGYLAQIKDPSRVRLGLTKNVGDKDNQSARPGHGQLATDMCKTYNALCAVNAGGFVDVGGVGTGGIPVGTVVIDGVYTKYTETTDHKLIGFNRDNVLVIGDFTEEEVREQGIRDAMSWRAPTFLVYNGQPVEHLGLAGGYDPRTAIGQCADGTVLLLVVESTRRGTDGANFTVMTDIMYEFDAVNAANLDGGTSSSFVLENKLLNTVCNPAIAHRGRYLATCWLVDRAEKETEK